MNESFRAAVWEWGDRGRLTIKQRRAVRQLCANPFAVDMLMAELESSLTPEALGAFGDGAILDRFALWIKWLIEHQDQVLQFIEKLIAIIFSIF